MSTNPLVSVVIIFLNEEKFLQEAIASVLAQHYQNWEIFLVDDGSTDASPGIAQGYQAAYPESVTYLAHPGRQNRGMSASRNLGLEHAGGRYIAFLDADDVWMPEKLEEQVAILESCPDCAMVCGAAQFWYSWSGRPEDCERDQIAFSFGGMQLHTPVPPPTLLTAFLTDEGACPRGPLLRRDAMEALQGYENVFNGMYEDQVFYAKLCLEFPAIISDACWYRYRRHEHSCVATAHRAGLKPVSRYNFLSWLSQYLSNRGMGHSAISTRVDEQVALLVDLPERLNASL